MARRTRRPLEVGGMVSGYYSVVQEAEGKKGGNEGRKEVLEDGTRLAGLEAWAAKLPPTLGVPLFPPRKAAVR